MKTKPVVIVTAVIATLIVIVAALLQSFPGERQRHADEKWRIVNYWSEWCAPCRREIPMLNQLSRELQATNVAIVGVNFDEDPREKSLVIASGMGIEFPTLTIENVLAMQLALPDVLPTTYILSPENHVLAKLIGEQTKESLLAKLTSLGLPGNENYEQE